MKRICPRVKDSLKQIESYHKICDKVTKRSRAIPRTPLVMKELFRAGLLRKQSGIQLSQLARFIFNISAKRDAKHANSAFLILGDDLMVVGVWGHNIWSGRVWEKMVLKARLVIGILVCSSAHAFSHFYKEAVGYFRLHHAKRPPHGVGRGGSTWHLGLYGSYDKTQEHGR